MNHGGCPFCARKHTGRRKAWVLVALVCFALTPNVALAQATSPGSPSAQDRAAARSLLESADNAWNRGEYKRALNFFTRAYELVNAPTIAIRRAECLEKLGQLIEAGEIYISASRYPITPNSIALFREAVAVAAERAVTVRTRFGKMAITIEGDDVENADVFVDGRRIQPALAETTFPVDPGRRVVEVVKGDRKASETVRVEEGGSVRVILLLPSVVKVEPDSSPSSYSTLGWVLIGVGAAGLVTGGTAGLVAMGQRNTFIDSGVCPDYHCWGKQSEIDTYNRTKIVSSVGFAVGIVGVGAGLAFLLLSPEKTNGEAAGVRPWVGGSGFGIGPVGLEGSF